MNIKELFKHVFTNTKKTPKEYGRSILEMLGVLAIIGVLAVGGIAGFNFAMNKLRANEIINDVGIRAMEFSRQLVMGVEELNQTEFRNTTSGGYFVDAFILERTRSYFEISLYNVPSGVCREILRMDWKAPSGIYVNKINYNDDENVCGTEPVQMDFVFGGDLEGKDNEVCKSDSDCAYCSVCIDNLCQNPNNSIYVNGKCVIGNPCYDGAVWNEQKQQCECSNNQVYVNGKCELFKHCGTEATWNDAQSKCVCNDSTLVYNELAETCEENTCESEGKYTTYYMKSGVYYPICCDEGESGAYVDENNEIHTNGYCCPKGLTVSITDSKKYGFQGSFCMGNVCSERDAVTFFVSGIDVPICCGEGVTAAATSITGETKGEPVSSGICCPVGWSQFKGFRKSYCVPDVCPSDKPNRLTYKNPTCGGDAAGHTDVVPICCPTSSKAAAYFDEKGGYWEGGYCCPEGYGTQSQNCGWKCVVEECPEGQNLLEFHVNWGRSKICCPADVSAAATRDSDFTKYNKNGICCQPGETALQAQNSHCQKAECPEGKHFVPYMLEGYEGKTCCPEGVTGAKVREVGSYPVCCNVGEDYIPGWTSSCVPASCAEGEELTYFSSYELYTSKGQSARKCCPIGRKAARCTSSGTCGNGWNYGYCCEEGEDMVESTGQWSWCVPTSCPASSHMLSFQHSGISVNKCCPTSSKAAAYYDSNNKSYNSGVCCGENEIVVAKGSYQKCQACDTGLVPNESGDACI